MNLQESTQSAAQSAELLCSAIRQAHSAACNVGGEHRDALEILLFHAIADATKLMHRLEAVAACAASPRYTQP